MGAFTTLRKWGHVLGPIAAFLGVLYLLLDHHAPDVSHTRIDKPIERRFD